MQGKLLNGALLHYLSIRCYLVLCINKMLLELLRKTHKRPFEEVAIKLIFYYFLHRYQRVFV